MKNLNFKNQDLMPVVGLGTWKSAPGEVFEAIIEAIKLGYRHFDCAPRYENEPEIGHALQHAIQSGLVKRDELWITSKLWNNAHRNKDVIPALQRSLANLRLDYLDLYLIHWPVHFKSHIGFPKNGQDLLAFEDIPMSETWGALEIAVQQGLVKHIGVSNFSILKLQQLLSTANIKPALNQVELHPFLRQHRLVNFCRKNKIHVTAYSPLGSNDRLDWLKQKNEPSLLEHPDILAISESNSCSPAQVILTWSISRGIAVIPKSTNAGRMKENLLSVEIKLSQTEMNTISQLDKHYRYITGTIWTIPGSPYTLKNLWDE